VSWGISPSERIASVKGLTLFSDLAIVACSTIVSAADEKRFWRRQTIFYESDPIKQVILLLSGCVKITQLGLGGQEVILRLCVPGEVVGDFPPSGNVEHWSTAQVVQSSIALVWQVAVFERLLDSFPAFRRNVVRALEERLREMEQRFREVSSELVASRLSSELVRLTSRFGNSVDGHKEILLSRRELAQLTGTTLSTVSRLLSRWQKLGIVNIRREAVEVRDFAALTELAVGETELTFLAANHEK
jgi:CRP-like cAMP-binding protein